MTLNTALAICAAYGGLLYAVFTVVLSVRAWRRSGVRWPLSGRWLIAAMFCAWAVRVEHVAGVRLGLWGHAGTADLLALAQWIAIDVTTTAVLWKWLRGRLLFCEDDRAERMALPPGVIYDRRSPRDRRRGWGRLTTPTNE